MGWNWVSPPFLALGLFVAWTFFTTLNAQQDPCSSMGLTITITFPEDVLNSTITAPVQRSVSSSPEQNNLVVTQDLPGLNPKYRFSEYFSVGYNPTQRYFYISNIKGIDRDGPSYGVDDDVNILQYRFSCTPPGSSTTFSVLKIQITDINDNAPIFQQSNYYSNVNELTPIGLVINNAITAFDSDEGDNSVIFYSLSDNTGVFFASGDKFAVPVEGQGLVSVNNNLDFESMYNATGNRADQCFYNLTVTATDRGNPPRSATASLIILIEDGDDQGPEFLYPSCILSTDTYRKSCIRARYLTNLPSGTGQQLLVFTPDPADPANPDGTVSIIAQDRDTLNSPITCQIAQTVPAGYQQYFSVVSQQVGQTKQYKCIVTYNPGANPISPNNLQSLDIILEVFEVSFNRKQETATISVSLAQVNTGPPVVTPSSTTSTRPPVVTPSSTTSTRPPVVTPSSTTNTCPPVVTPSSTTNTCPPVNTPSSTTGCCCGCCCQYSKC